MQLNANQKDTLKCREYQISGILNLSGTTTLVGSMQAQEPAGGFDLPADR